MSEGVKLVDKRETATTPNSPGKEVSENTKKKEVNENTKKKGEGPDEGKPCAACTTKQHIAHDRGNKNCRLYGIPLQGSSEFSCRACRGHHVGHSWDSNCALQNTPGRRKGGEMAKALYAELDQIECRVYSSAEVSKSTGLLRELFRTAAAKEVGQMTSTGTLVPMNTPTQVSNFKAMGGQLLPPCVVWSVKKVGGVPVGRCRWTCAGNRQVGPIDPSSAATSSPDAIAVRTLLISASHYGWGFTALDIQGAFLNAPLHEEEKSLLGVTTPRAFIDLDLITAPASIIVNSMYGLRSSPAAWAQERDRGLSEISDELKGLGICISRCAVDSETWIMTYQGAFAGLVLAYVDDFALTGVEWIRQMVTEKIKARWACGKHVDLPAVMTGDGVHTCEFLGMEITRTSVGYDVTQSKYIKKVLARYELEDCNPVTTPFLEWSEPDAEEEVTRSEVTAALELVGSLLWASTKTRVDISYSTQVLASYASSAPRWSRRASAC